ncbi:MAG: MBOAT family protein [Clostridia bacterium]|nr:MBOAT family protein [Clostridia bacterium]
MVFSDTPFLFVFLPILLILYYLTPRQAKNYLLLAASLLFYFTGEPKYTLLLIASALGNYLFALAIEGLPRAKKPLLILAVVLNVGTLVFFKFSAVWISGLNALLGTSFEPLALPLGISFYTFQAMSYTIDVYRGEARLQRNPFAFATYLCLFPQLIAGPIVRYTDVDEELSHRRHTLQDFSEGLARFTVGLAKKVILANNLGVLCDTFRQAEAPSAAFGWLYAVCYALQIYFDFSGYSDMAIGLGRVFGFHFPENFDYPYISGSITEFWRRWHKTLSGWFRDYVYIPLGGSRVSRPRWMLNLLTVWALTGLWHGSGTGVMNFILWGALYGVLLCLEKLFLGKIFAKVRPVGHLFVIAVTLFGFVLFGADGLAGALSDLAILFGRSGLTDPAALYYWRSGAVLIAVAVIGATPLPKKCWDFLQRRAEGVTAVLQPLLVVAALAISTAYIVGSTFNPFLYFRF